MGEVITPQEAFARKAGSTWKHVDVRTEGEFSNGRPTASVNVPFLNAGLLGMSNNPKFVDDMVALAAPLGGKDTKLIISCQSGKRSAAACAALEAEGFTNLADIEGGYAAWASDNALPVEKS
jgi:rhodanese-related sulfurtransferase